MGIADLLGAVRRRWYVVVVGLLATVGLGLVASTASPPTYTARGLVLLVPSKAVVGHGGNPLLVMDGLTLPAAILVAYYQGSAAQAEAADVVPTATYVISVDDSTRGPVIAIDVADPTAAGAMKALRHLASSVPDNLRRLQTEVEAPPRSVVSAMPLTMDTKATRDDGTATRLRIAAIAVGLVATMLLTTAIDGLLTRRSRRRSPPAPGEPAAAAGPGGAGGGRAAAPGRGRPDGRAALGTLMATSFAPGEGPRLDVVTWLSGYLALLLLVPSKLVLGPLGSAGSPSMVLGLGSLLLWGLLRLLVREERAAAPQPVKVAVWLFLLAVGVSFVLAMSRPIDPDEVSPADVALLAAASWTGTLLLLHDLAPGRERLDTLLWRLVLCGGAVGLLGIVQVLTGQAWVDRVSVPGLTLTEVTGTFTRGAFVRPAGTSVHPIEYGVVITMLLPLALHMGVHRTSRPLLLRWAPAVALAGVVPLTSSRSAYLGAIVGLLVYLLGWPAQRRTAALGLTTGGVLTMAVVTPTLLGSIVGLFSGASNDPSIASRTESYQVAGVFIDRNPWFGRGLGTFLPKYRIFDNQYLGLLVAVGVVGTALFVLIAVVAVATLRRVRRSAADEATRDLALALAAGVVVGFVGLAMFDAFSFPMTMGTLFLLLGAAGALHRLEVPPRYRGDRPRSSAATVAAP